MKMLLNCVLVMSIMLFITGCGTLGIIQGAGNSLTNPYGVTGVEPFGKSKDINGYTLIAGKDVFYTGTHTSGLWFDKNDTYTLPPEERNGWGIKFDIMFGQLVSPEPYFWNYHFYFEDIKTNDIPKEQWETFFGKDLADKMVNIDPNWWTKSAYNPWCAKFWFVLRLPLKIIPYPFLSIGTPWKSVYIGFKDYGCEPLLEKYGNPPYAGNDSTWAQDADRENVKNHIPSDSIQYLCPTSTIRSKR